MENLLDCKWFQVPALNENGDLIGQRNLGIVAKKSYGHESWKAYMGVCSNEPADGDFIGKEKKDIEAILKNGAQLEEREAKLWFPSIELPYRQ